MSSPRKIRLNIVIALVTAVALGGCTQGRVLIDGEYGVIEVHKNEHRHRHERHREREHEHEHRYKHKRRKHHGKKGHGRKYYKKIPPGHLPPPGKCRIWYPGLPPGPAAPARQLPPPRPARTAGSVVDKG